MQLEFNLLILTRYLNMILLLQNHPFLLVHFLHNTFFFLGMESHYMRVPVNIIMFCQFLFVGEEKSHVKHLNFCGCVCAAFV